MTAFDIGYFLCAMVAFGGLLLLGAIFYSDRPSREAWKDSRRRNPIPQYRERWWRG